VPAAARRSGADSSHGSALRALCLSRDARPLACHVAEARAEERARRHRPSRGWDQWSFPGLRSGRTPRMRRFVARPSSALMKAARPAIQTFLESTPDAAKVDAFLENRSIPIVEGPSVTFLWRGEATGVNLRHWIYGLESANPLTRVPNTDLWYLTLDIPHGS